MLKKPPFFRGLAIFISLCLFGSDIARAFPESGLTILPKSEVPSFLRIDIPKELASVEEIYQAPPKVDPRLILHIENVHGNYEAQLQIKKLLQYLHEKYGFKLIFAEGAVEKLNPEYLELFSDKERNLELADRLAKEGELTGIEYFLMNRPEDVEAVGIEKAELYRKNYEAFKKVYSRKAKTETFLNRYDQKLEMLSSRIFGPDLRRVLSEWKKFEKGHREFLPFVKQLAEDGKKFTGTDLESLFSQVEWPQMTRLLVLQSMEADMEAEAAKKERARLVEFLKSERISPPVIKAIENLGEKQITMSRILPQEDSLEDLPRNLLEKLVEEAGPKGFHFADYPAFSLWAGYLILQSELDTKLLFREIEKLFEKILQELAVTERQKNLLELYRDADLLRKVFALELSRTEWDRAVYRKEWISPAVMIRRIRIITREKESAGPRHVKNSVILRATGGSREEDELFSTGSNHNDSQSNLTNLLNQATHSDAVRPEYQSFGVGAIHELPLQSNRSKSATLSVIFNTAFQFYEFARQREAVFYETIEREMSSRKAEKAILVTGGFHTEGLMDIFRQQEINYSVLMPRISDQPDKSGYISSMLENKKTLFDLAQLEAIAKLQRSEIRRMQGEQRSAFGETVMNEFLNIASNYKSRAELRKELEKFDQRVFARDNGIGLELLSSEAGNDVFRLTLNSRAYRLVFEENNGRLAPTFRSEVRAAKKDPKAEFDYYMSIIGSGHSIKAQIEAVTAAGYLLREALEEDTNSTLSSAFESTMERFFQELRIAKDKGMQKGLLGTIAKFFWRLDPARQKDLIERLKQNLTRRPADLKAVESAIQSIWVNLEEKNIIIQNIEILEAFAGFLDYDLGISTLPTLNILKHGDPKILQAISGLPERLKFFLDDPNMLISIKAEKLLEKLGVVNSQVSPAIKHKPVFYLNPKQLRKLHAQITKRGMPPSNLFEKYIKDRKIILFESTPVVISQGTIRDIQKLADQQMPVLLILEDPPMFAQAFEHFIRKEPGGNDFLDYLIHGKSGEENAKLYQERLSFLPKNIHFAFYGSDPGVSPPTAATQKIQRLAKVLKDHSNENNLVFGFSEDWLKSPADGMEDSIATKLQAALAQDLRERLIFVLEESAEDWKTEVLKTLWGGRQLHNLNELLRSGFYLPDFALELGKTLMDRRPFRNGFHNKDGSYITLRQSHDALIFRSDNDGDDPDFFQKPVLPRPRKRKPPRRPLVPIRSEIRAAISADIPLGRGLAKILTARSELRLAPRDRVAVVAGGIVNGDGASLIPFAYAIEALRLPEEMQRVEALLRQSKYLGRSDAHGALEVVTFEEPTKDQIESYAAMLLSQTGQRLHIIYSIEKPSLQDLIEKQEAADKIVKELQNKIKSKVDLRGKEWKNRIRIDVIPIGELKHFLIKAGNQLFNQLNNQGVGLSHQAFQSHFVQLFIGSTSAAGEYGNPLVDKLTLTKDQLNSAGAGVFVGMRLSQAGRAEDLDEQTRRTLEGSGRTYTFNQSLAILGQALGQLINSIRSELRVKSAA